MSRLHPPKLSLAIVNDLAEIGRIAPIIEKFCAEHGLGEETAHAINLSLDELLTNTISYGFEDGGRHVIDIVVEAQGDRAVVTVKDDAAAFDPTEAGDPDLDADLDERPIGGLGIHIVRAMMDDIVYARVGGHNQLTLTKISVQEG
ncbi:ATP-binding protein [Mesorhizobium sp. LHD-90]|uniref:ATP-binding protein n=1 Tax=Mesorhizobium sp. LHD-90 TaxID=3071414 RepID=UPI0027DFC636|nr:ATP-binding protein [Mesorhizobium sp. LHD-90]MDQ6435511.1 ATP-binding protein [Mesorhizobium sp. LHD-90]